jgi:hypothetical protein
MRVFHFDPPLLPKKEHNWKGIIIRKWTSLKKSLQNLLNFMLILIKNHKNPFHPYVKRKHLAHNNKLCIKQN